VLVNGQSGRPEGKCNREQTADGCGNATQVRVKRCGKSAPATVVTRRLGKPHSEQDQAEHGRPVLGVRVDRIDGWPSRRRAFWLPLRTEPRLQAGSPSLSMSASWQSLCGRLSYEPHFNLRIPTRRSSSTKRSTTSRTTPNPLKDAKVVLYALRAEKLLTGGQKEPVKAFNANVRCSQSPEPSI
jgi:hypothetical protein